MLSMLISQYAHAATVFVTPGATVPATIPSGDIYILDGTNTFYGNDITIRPNAKLIIRNGAVLKMNSNKKIIVENGITTSTTAVGGILEINKGTITRNSNSISFKWSGVEIRGVDASFDYGKTYAYRGKAVLNDAKIQYALCAIKNAQRVPSTTFIDYIKKGGVVQATKSEFHNNDSMALLYGYKYPYTPSKKSIPLNGYDYFVDCKFHLDSDFNYEGSTLLTLHPWFIRMYDMDGLNILACKFINNKFFTSATSSTPFMDRNTTAIFANNSRFRISNAYQVMGTVTPPLTYGPDPSWGVGIGVSTGVTGPVTVFGTSLIENFYQGVWVENEFSLAPVNIERTKFDNVTYGTIIQGSALSLQYRDTFKLTEMLGECYSMVGSPMGSEVKAIKNFFAPKALIWENYIEGTSATNCTRGIEVLQAGTDMQYVHGNHFKNIKWPLYGAYNNYLPSDHSVGLKFTCNELRYSDAHDRSKDITVDVDGAAPDHYIYYYSLTDVVPFALLRQTPRNRFSDKADTGLNIKNILSNYQFNYYYLFGADYTKPNFNSENVETFLGAETSCNPKKKSKYVASTFATIATLDMNAQHIRRLLSYSQLSILQQDSLIYYNAVYYTTLDNYLETAVYHNDSGAVPIADLIAVLKVAKANPAHQWILAETYGLLGAYDSALQVINAIPSLFTLNNDDAQMVAEFNTLLPILSRYYAMDGMWASLSTADQQAIIYLKDNGTGRVKVAAHTLWNRHLGNDRTRYELFAPYTNNNNGAKGASIIGKVDDISVYPNPSSDILHVTLPISKSDKKYEVQIIDNMGKVTHQDTYLNPNITIDVSNMANGIYQLIVRTDAGKGYKSRFTKLK